MGCNSPAEPFVSAVLGIWLMFAPAVFGTGGLAAGNYHLVGALITTVAVIVMAEVIRAGRFLNVLFGVWMIAVPWLLSRHSVSTTGRWNDVVVAAVVILLSLPRGRIQNEYGAWDRMIV